MYMYIINTDVIQENCKYLCLRKRLVILYSERCSMYDGILSRSRSLENNSILFKYYVYSL